MKVPKGLRNTWRKTVGHTRFTAMGAVAVVMLVVGYAILDGDASPQRSVNVANTGFWLFSSQAGEVGHVNAADGRVDMRRPLTDATGHEIRVEENDSHLLLHDLTANTVSSLDLNTLNVSAQVEVPSEITLSLHDDQAFIVDTARGLVTRLDPERLTVVGKALQLPRGLINAGFDGKGVLWLAAPSEGTTIAVTVNKAKNGSRKGGKGPRAEHVVDVSTPDSALKASALNDGVAIVDYTNGAVSTVRGKDVRKVHVPKLSDPKVQESQGSDVVTLTDSPSGQVIVVDGKDVHTLQIPNKNVDLGGSLEFNKRVYVADDTNHVVYVFNKDGSAPQTIQVPEARGRIALRTHGEYLAINAPDASVARVIDRDHRVRIVDKQPKGVAGAPARKSPTPAPTGRDDRRVGNDGNFGGNNGNQGGREPGPRSTPPAPPSLVPSRSAPPMPPPNKPTTPAAQGRTSGPYKPRTPSPTPSKKVTYPKTFKIDYKLLDKSKTMVSRTTGSIRVNGPATLSFSLCLTNYSKGANQHAYFNITYVHADGTSTRDSADFTQRRGGGEKTCFTAPNEGDGKPMSAIRITYVVKGVAQSSETRVV